MSHSFNFVCNKCATVPPLAVGDHTKAAFTCSYNKSQAIHRLFDSLEYLFSSIHLELLLEPLKLFLYRFKGPRHINLSWWMVKCAHVKEKQVLHKTWLNWSTTSLYLSFDSTYLIHSPWKMATSKKIKLPILYLLFIEWYSHSLSQWAMPFLIQNKIETFTFTQK